MARAPYPVLDAYPTPVTGSLDPGRYLNRAARRALIDGTPGAVQYRRAETGCLFGVYRVCDSRFLGTENDAWVNACETHGRVTGYPTRARALAAMHAAEDCDGCPSRVRVVPDSPPAQQAATDAQETVPCPVPVSERRVVNGIDVDGLFWRLAQLPTLRKACFRNGGAPTLEVKVKPAGAKCSGWSRSMDRRILMRIPVDIDQWTLAQLLIHELSHQVPKTTTYSARGRRNMHGRAFYKVCVAAVQEAFPGVDISGVWKVRGGYPKDWYMMAQLRVAHGQPEVEYASRKVRGPTTAPKQSVIHYRDWRNTGTRRAAGRDR